MGVRAHYCFRNNEVRSEVSESELDLTMGLRLEIKRNEKFQLKLLTDNRFAYWKRLEEL